MIIPYFSEPKIVESYVKHIYFLNETLGNYRESLKINSNNAGAVSFKNIIIKKCIFTEDFLE